MTPTAENDAPRLTQVAYAILDLMPLDPTGHIAQCAWDDSKDHPACGCSGLPGQIVAVLTASITTRVKGEA